MEWRVYALHHPTTGAVRYVGMTTTSLHVRHRAHCSAGRAQSPRRHVYKWWQSVVSKTGLEPVIREIECGDTGLDHADERERYWIATLRSKGARLTNATPGGQVWTPEQIKRRSDAVRGRVVPDEQRERMSKTIAERGGRVGKRRQITDQEIADIRTTYTGAPGQKAAIARAIPYSIVTVKRALDLSLWSIPDDVVGRQIALDAVNRPGGNAHFRSTTPEQVREIRRRYDSGERCATIAEDMGIRLGRVQKIAYRNVFRDVA